MQIEDLDFQLPPDLIAQAPTPDRAASRLLHYSRAEQRLAHRTFSDLPSLLRAGDVLVFNDSRVIPARFVLQKGTGGRIEGLFLAEELPGVWRVLLRDVGSLRPGARLSFLDDGALEIELTEKLAEGEWRLRASFTESAPAVLARVGRMPLPPYIKRAKERDDRDDLDRQRYQTVYAQDSGSVAAPTAGLHFTAEVFQQLQAKHVEQAFVTLHVGMGTFKPITADRIEDHAMHAERYTIPPAAAEQINRAKREGRRVVAVGTTVTRVLESQPPGEIRPGAGETSIYIYPPYAWKHVGALLTNFHLPKSTLIALVAAFVGLEAQRRIYHEAVEQKYRFFSYGDSSFLE